jgi:hypothetical protein
MENGKVNVHVRFAPNGSVVEISERPAALAPQEWFNRLSLGAGETYQTLAGGRGLFRLAPAKLDAVKKAVLVS